MTSLLTAFTCNSQKNRLLWEQDLTEYSMAAILDEEKVFNELQPELIELEQERLQVQKQIKKINNRWLITILAVLAATVVLSLLLSSLILIVASIGAAIIMVGLIRWTVEISKTKKPYIRKFKTNVIGSLLSKVDPSLKLIPEGVINEEHIRRSKILAQEYGKYICDDMIAGVIDGHEFEFAEVKLITEVKGSESIHFQGAFGIVKLNEAVASPVWVVPDATNRFRDSIGLKGSKGDVVLFDHEEFEKAYKVYAQDPDVAKSLMPGVILDRLTEIYSAVYSVSKDKNAVRFAVIDDYLYISVRIDYDLFEARTSKPINDLDYIAANIRYLLLMINLIYTLKLK